MALQIDLDGKTALVTGAGRGLGKAIALGLSQAGAKVALAARTTEQLEEAAHEITQAGGEVIAVSTDVTESGSVEKFVKFLNDFCNKE